VDYQAVFEVARAILEGPPRKLAETLAESVAAEVLKKFKLVKAVEVEVTKPSPPVRFAFAGFSAGVRRERVGKGKKDAMGSHAQAPQKRRAVASDAPTVLSVRRG
jgi:dihydroneopterin aldolase